MSEVQTLLNRVVGDGARPTRWDCFVYFPAQDDKYTNMSQDIKALVKTSQFPGKTNEPIEFKFKGHTIPLKGATVYDNSWSCTFYLTEDHGLKSFFEDWIESLDHQHYSREVKPNVKDFIMEEGYTSTVRIMQKDFTGTKDTAVYELYNVFPKSIEAIDVDYSEITSISEFTVEFSYSHYHLFPFKNPDGTSIVQSLVDSVNESIDDFVDENLTALKDQAAESINNIISFAQSKVGGLLGDIGISNVTSEIKPYQLMVNFEEYSADLIGGLVDDALDFGTDIITDTFDDIF